MKQYILAAILFATPATGQPAEVIGQIANPMLLGKATGTLLRLPIFDAELWVGDGKKFSFNETFALTLSYRYNFSAAILAKATISEMARMEDIDDTKISDLSEPLKACFADVRKGDRITGIGKSKDKIDFFVNKTKSCTLSYANIRKRFFSIWLGSKTRDPQSSAKLKGM